MVLLAMAGESERGDSINVVGVHSPRRRKVDVRELQYVIQYVRDLSKQDMEL